MVVVLHTSWFHRSSLSLLSPLSAVGDTLNLFFSATTLSTALAAFYLHYLRAKWLLSCC
jgi:hypothetical protein